PYAKRTAQGLILGPDGVKMSKSRGNVIDPNDVVEKLGADALRTYILFMGEYGSAAPWSESSVMGCKRFLERIADLPQMAKGSGVTEKLEVPFNKTVKKVSSDIEEMKFNTAIAAMMELVNEINSVGSLTVDELGILVRLLCPFAPHLCEEIWANIGGEGFCSLAPWPTYDEAKTVDSSVEIAVQINGKLRATIMLPRDCPKDDAIAAAKSDERVLPLIEGKTIVKEIAVPNKIVNIVVK
ncbi:MAG: leucine--tRNA ligase, partial [Ruminococcaceae bacterium]|nr:leucine--tRNA ligase [Oscillospiraceae bacterium]